MKREKKLKKTAKETQNIGCIYNTKYVNHLNSYTQSVRICQRDRQLLVQIAAIVRKIVAARNSLTLLKQISSLFSDNSKR